MQSNKSINPAKAKQQATHEFFPRSRGADQKGGLIFNKAPINKQQAYQETKTKVLHDREEQANHQRSAQLNPKAAAASGSFLSKLYQDDDQYDELRVLGLVDEEDHEVQEAREVAGSIQAGMAKRKTKAIEKMDGKSQKSSQKVDSSAPRIGKLALKKGTLGLFAICEIGDNCLIVNHTRNTKGYIPLAGSKLTSDQFKLGQLVVAAVNAEIGGAQTGQIYSFASGSAGLNRKIQLSLDCVHINKHLTTDTVTKSMVLQAHVESKEAKGYILDLGFRDKAKGFLKFSDDAVAKSLKTGHIVHIVVKSVMKGTKVVKCELISESNCNDCVQQWASEATKKNDQTIRPDEEAGITVAQIKPGFLVQGKISKQFANGVEITFLGGLTATCFEDHLAEDQGSASSYKIGQKVAARVVSVDPLSKKMTMSLKSGLVNWQSSQSADDGELHKLTVGQIFEDAKVTAELYGGSYLVSCQDSGSEQKLTGFLHRSHAMKEQAPDEVEEEQNPDEPPKRQAARDELNIGQVLNNVKIKEINYFDRVPILSMRGTVLASKSLNYHMIEVGQFYQAKIAKVNLDKKFITLSINDFVKGNLHIEHMADNALKVLPPKLQEVGKEIRVRILNVDAGKRSLEFTRKDTLMKESTPVYKSIKEVKKGDKVVGVIVAESEHGYVVKSFGNLKGLLTFEDIKEKLSKGHDSSQFKPGSIVKAYVLFKKKEKGMALTLSKKKAKADAPDQAGATEGQEQGAKTIENGYLPSEEQVEAILSDSRFSTMAKATKDLNLVGQVHKFRVLENDESKPCIIVKSIDAEKKSKNFIGILPRCLVTNHPSINLPLNNPEFISQGIILELLHQQIPVISFQPELVLLKDQILRKSSLDSKDEADQQLRAGSSYVGVVNGIVGKAGHVSVRFMDGIQKSMKVKDLNTTQDYKSLYYPGKVIRVAVNKLERLCTKSKVIEACLAGQPKAALCDKEVQIKSFSEAYAQSIQDTGLNVGQMVEASVQLVKDYGLIAQIKNETEEPVEVQTGFIIHDQQSQQKYKQGQALRCRVIDVDPVKKIADLSEKLVNTKAPKSGGKELQVGAQCKAIVELNKEAYLIVSIKNDRSKICLCIMSNFNKDDATNPGKSSQIGDEIDVKVVGKNESGRYELVPVVDSSDKKKQSSSPKESIELKEGIKFTGPIKSIKNQCMYIQVPSAQKKNQYTCIGRLHMIECQGSKEFKQYAVGDRIEAKILKVTHDEGKGRTWIELTRNENHMQKVQGLDAEQLEKTVMSETDLKIGQKYSALIVSSSWDKEEPVNLKFSHPIQVQVSPFVRGSIPFNQIVPVEELAQHGSQILLSKKFKIGQRVELTHVGKGEFSMLSKTGEAANQTKKSSKYKKGDLTIARYVKHVRGRGVTVQVGDGLFGFIEMCEITDEISGNVFKYLEQKSIFAARVIDLDKNGKLQLSARDSVVDDNSWRHIRPEGQSIHFQENDKLNQASGNLRNKILKYGANVALQRGNLAIGYIVNIGKAGCFIQIGHNCVVRAGLNELNDSSSFNFHDEMPIGRVVLGRISKVDEPAGADKRFHFSTRLSLVVYGVGGVDRSKLEVGGEVESIMMAFAEGKAFAQIKGSYIKIKVKGFKASDGLKAGDHIISTLKKVTKEKISSEFVGRVGQRDGSTEASQEELRVQSIYDSVKEEAERDIEAIKALGAPDAGNQKGADFDESLIQQRNFLDKDEQIIQQIEDLNDLEKKDEEDEVQDQDDRKIDSEDSDAEEMKRLIRYDDQSGSEEAEEDQDMEDESGSDEMDDEEEGEDESDEEMSGEEKEPGDDSDSSVDEKQNSKNLKKRTLKERLREEQEIRDKEKRMRSDQDKPKDIDDFERLLVANQDQSYLWIQYMAFMLDNLGIDAARKVVERAVKSVGISNDQDKLNIWTAFMNLESNFGTQETLESCTKRALEVNDRKKIYLNLIDIYKGGMQYQYVEAIYKQLAKKYNNSLEIWAGYLEFLIEMQQKKEEDKQFLIKDVEFSEPKSVLQRALQALTKDQHVNMISKYGMLEFKHGAPENGRTMFEGIVNNYPKRMDIWSIYMDMEMKYGQGNVTQARHLFERCLNNESIQKKPKKMKLVFQKYMEYENKEGNKNNLQKLRERVEEYLSKVYDQNKDEEMSGDGKQPSEDDE